MQPGVILDIVLVVILLVFTIRGWRAGLLGSLGGIIGLAVGGVGAFFAIPLVASWVPDAQWRGWAAVGAAIVILAIGYSLGSLVGGAVGSVVRQTPLRGLERLLGAALNLVVTALVLVTAALGVGSLGIPLLAQAVGSSAVIGTIDRVTPVPMKSALAQLRSTVVDGGAQRVIEAFGGTTDVPAAPQLDTSTAALQRAAQSVVRISGTAESCSRSLTGSGFVVADDLVMTNAHVVAGVTNPVVEVPGEMPRAGRIVYFDPVDDLAVIRVDDLGARTLPLVANPAPGSNAVVAGYPYGGPYTAGGAQVIVVGPSLVADITGANPTSRQVITLSGTVQPGNSGGPLLTEAGEVTGVIFARDANSAPIGYALAMDEILPVVALADTLQAAIPSGACVAE
ncbi:MAG TPA: MarP family serine protease [Plantibacter sp.]|uniref:MarP family serine protease n=1 Tax=unclassified Plantibacter TaxID=2624265 RepID=UPI002BC4D662|nr:MarP family serine protease [Plantibacter sp.]